MHVYPESGPESARAPSLSEMAGPREFAPTNEPSSEHSLTRDPRSLSARVQESYGDIIQKLFIDREDGKERCLYRVELDAVARKLGSTPELLLRGAAQELREHGERAKIDRYGRITNPKSIGPYFAALMPVIARNIDLYVIHDQEQLSSRAIPFSDSYKEQFRAVLARGESIIALLVKNPPKEAVVEIEELSKRHFDGVMSFWSDAQFRERVPKSQKLSDWMARATIRVLCTGEDQACKDTMKAVNESIERSLEGDQLVRAIRQITHNYQRKAFWTAAVIVGPIMAAVPGIEAAGKWVERISQTPGLAEKIVHTVGGALDDVASVAANAMQSMVGTGSLWEKVKRGLPALTGGLGGIPVAMGLCLGSSYLYETGVHPLQLLGGVMFALGCSLGTVGASIGEYRETLHRIKGLEKSPAIGDLVAAMSPWQKRWCAFKDAILNVPFRLGHSVIGVSLQVGLAIAAVEGGFFKNPHFVTVEGVLESVAGVAAALAIPFFMRKSHQSKIRDHAYVGPISSEGAVSPRV